jgi:hypothetical protein
MAATSKRLSYGLVSDPSTPSQFEDTPVYFDVNASDVAVEWTAVPTLQNSWADVTGYQAAEYRVYANGEVQLRGVIDSGTKTAGTLITTLPAGARPAAKQTFTVASDVAAGAVGTLVIDTDGTVVIGTVDFTAASQVSLSNVRFDIA